MPSRRPHAVSSYGAAVDRSRQEQRPQTDSSPRRQRDKMGRDTTARPHLPHTVRQKEKSQPRQPGHAEAGGVPHDAANEIPYLYTSHQQTVMAPAHRPEPATVLVVPNLPGQVKKEAHRGNGKNSYHIEIKQFLMSKVYIIIIMRQKEQILRAQGKSLLPTHFPGPFSLGPDDHNQPAIQHDVLDKVHLNNELCRFKTESARLHLLLLDPKEAYSIKHSFGWTTF